MRDLLIAGIVAWIALVSLRQPWIGAVASVCISLMSPHVEFGYAAAGWPVAAAVAGCTIIGLLGTRDRQSLMLGPPVAFFFAFWAWVTITLMFAIYFDRSQDLWLRSTKIFVLVTVSLMLVNDRRKLEWLVWAIAGSLGYYGFKGGLFTLQTGGSYRVWGPGGFVEGNNELAAALVCTIPLIRYLQLQATKKWQQRGLLGLMALTGITVLGSQSRGALLAIVAMGAMLWVKTDRHKFVWAVALVVVAAAALSFMPDTWWARMETIKTYEQDDSATGRINAWWNAWNLATDRFFGGGFQIYTGEVFARYAPDPGRVHAAHSIYFQVLGEHGFVGLFLFCGIGVSTWFMCRRLIKLGRAHPELRWAGDLGSLLQVSIVGFSAGGAFLSLAYFDLPYYQMALAVIAHAVARRQLDAAAGRSVGLARPAPPAAAAPPTVAAPPAAR